MKRASGSTPLKITAFDPNCISGKREYAFSLIFSVWDPLAIHLEVNARNPNNFNKNQAGPYFIKEANMHSRNLAKFSML